MMITLTARAARAMMSVALCLCVASAGGTATAATRVLTPEDVTRARTIGEATASPDGTRVACVLVVPRRPGVDDDGPAWGELHVWQPGGAGSRPFVTGKISVSGIRWSPDGRRISFLAKREKDEKTTVWIIPADGGEAARAFTHGSDVLHYDWKPDGSGLAFVAAEPVPEEREALKKKGFDQVVYEEDWSPRRVYLVDLPGGEPKPLPPLPGQPFHVRWAPDGSRLLVDLAPTPLVDDEYMERRLHVIDAAGKVVAKVAHEGKVGDFGWSADGTQIVFNSAAHLNDTREGRLMAAPAAGGTPRELLPGLEGHVEEFAAVPGGVLYLASIGVGTRVGRVGLDGAGDRALFEGTSPVFASLSASRDGTLLALTGESPAFPRELFVSTAGAAPQRMTTSNPWLDGVTLGRQEIIRYNARDGLQIEGLLIHPVAGDARRAPLIVVAHGGPEGHFRNGWLTRYSDPGQVAAGLGYLVFYPNYRGSTGRGVAFAATSQGDAGGKEFDDVLDGIDELVRRGLADAARVGITGGSYGGYFTGWAATRHSARFAAGVMFVGMSNLVSKAGTTDIPREEELVHRRTLHLSGIADELQRSPISYVGKARTPLLILGGTADTRVDPGQSLELYRALKMKGGVPVRYVRYPGEAHGNRDSASRYDFLLRMLQWFDHFLVQGKKDLPPRDVTYAQF